MTSSMMEVDSSPTNAASQLTGVTVEKLFGDKPTMGNLEQMLTECHRSTFDRIQSGILSDEVLSTITTADLANKVIETAKQLEWATDAETIRDQNKWFASAQTFFEVDLSDLPPVEAMEELSKQSARKKMYIARLSQLVLLGMPARSKERIFYKNATVVLFDLCEQISESVRMQLLSMARAEPNSLVPTNKDMTFGFSSYDTSAASTFQTLVSFMLGKLQAAGMRRFGESCYAEIVVNGQRTHAWRSSCTIKEFIYEYTRKDACPQQWSNSTERGDCIPQLLSYLKNCSDHEFPQLEMNRDYLSFRNGIYCLSKNKFYPFDEDKADVLSESIVSMNYLNVNFNPANVDCIDWRTIETDTLDSIFKYQGYDAATLVCAYALLGRLLYEVGAHDNWQIGTFFKGIAGSGKSTIASLVKAIFPPSLIGTLSSNTEKKFGLSALYDKLVYICTEVKQDFALDQGEWQSMISGEDVSVAIKGETAMSVRWTTPGMLCGNELPRWVDASGSVVRRLVMFDFEKKVKNSNPNLLAELKDDIGTFVCKINRAYLEMVENYGKQGIWSPGVLSDQLHKYHRRLRCEVDALAAFIESDIVETVEGGIILESEFVNAYVKFRSDAGITSRVEWKKDHYKSVFDEHNLEIRKKVEFAYPPPSGPKVKANFVMGVCLRASTISG